MDSGERLLHRGRHKQYLKGIILEEDESGEDGREDELRSSTTTGISIAIPAKDKGDLLSPLQLGMYHEEDGSKEEEEEDDGGVWRSVTTPPSRRSADEISFDSFQESHLNPSNNSSKRNIINRVKSVGRVERSSRL